MGLSFDEDSMSVEASIVSLRFAAPDVVNSIPQEAGSRGSIVDQERRDDDIQITSSNHSDIEMVERWNRTNI